MELRGLRAQSRIRNFTSSPLRVHVVPCTHGSPRAAASLRMGLMMTTSREFRLTRHIVGAPTVEDFELHTVQLADPASGEVQVRNDWMSVDPYMRGRMRDAKSYAASFALGEVLSGAAIGTVVSSDHGDFAPGDVVQSMCGWREAFNAPASALQKVQAGGLPPQAFLGIAGMPGLTAYVGLLRIAALTSNEVVFVSAAAGAVGSIACQIAKLRGNRVVASAGGAEKAAYLSDELKVDVAIDYKATDISSALAAAAPDGVDVSLDNVGGDHLEAALANAKPFGRLALCGMISLSNAGPSSPGPRNIPLVIGKSLRVQGFIVGNHSDLTEAYLRDLRAWYADGRITWRETVLEGIERAPEAFLGLFTGRNLGKMLVRLS